MFCVGGKSGWSTSLSDILSMNNHHKPTRTGERRLLLLCECIENYTTFIINRVKNIRFLQYGSHTTVFAYFIPFTLHNSANPSTG